MAQPAATSKRRPVTYEMKTERFGSAHDSTITKRTTADSESTINLNKVMHIAA